MALTILSDGAIRRLRAMSDEELLRECDVQNFRGSGPGGQKRNKTSSGVRIVHSPSGCVGLASERRSKKQNMAEAIDRLRLDIAFELRCSEPVKSLKPVGASHRDFARFVADLLDALHQNLASIRDTATACGTTTSQIMNMICSDGRVLGKVNEMRRVRGMRLLRDRD
jgi:hypothetical protein